MLTFNSKYRISAKQAYFDPWIQANKIMNPLNVDYMNYLKEFNVIFDLTYIAKRKTQTDSIGIFYKFRITTTRS